MPSQTTNPPPRRFNPVPLETTHTSHKTNHASVPRKFNVEPIETTTSSSRQSQEERSTSSTTSSRRFTPQVLETSHTSSRDRDETKEKSGPRRFTPEVVETTHGTKRKASNGPPRKFVPELMETTSSSRHNSQSDRDASSQPRKFAPILIDSASRSRRTHISTPKTVSRTEDGFALHAREHRRHITGTQTPAEPVLDHDGDIIVGNNGDTPGNFDLSAQLRRQIQPYDGHRSGPLLTSQRTHSFRLPDLETIESSGSSAENSSPSSPTSSAGQDSPYTLSESSLNAMNHATRKRESVDETFSRYLLELQARKVQQRIQEEALLAAFPNSDFHQPVQHYMDNDGDSDDMEFEIEDRPVTYGPDDDLVEMTTRRRESTSVSWEQLEMQRHAEKRQQEANSSRITAKKPTESPWWNPNTVYGLEPPSTEMRSMLNRARPPMLGRSLVFPRCRSPDPARFDVTQGSTTLRKQMSQQTSAEPSQDAGLWQAAPAKTAQPSGLFKSPAPSTTSLKGLWGGCCVADKNKTSSLAPPLGPTGLMTPRPETDRPNENPFETAFANPAPGASDSTKIVLRTPPTPTSIHKGQVGQIDSMLNEQQELDNLMEKDYPDAFVTQVYNYLSLGYPSLARPFDAELSKITGVSMADLRGDDKKAKQTSKGYIRLGPDFEGGGGEGMTEQDCARWRALRLYVREWVRQEKNMVHADGPLANFGLGTGARRGSWAI